MNKDYRENRLELQKMFKRLYAKSPHTLKAMGAVHDAAYKSGAIKTKQKELIALGIGIVIRCEDCITFHTHEALTHGATAEEVTETIDVAIQMGGGPAIIYGARAADALDQFLKSS